jgi:hypothetical protein
MGVGIDEARNDPPSGDIDFPRFSREREPGALADGFDTTATDDHDGIGESRPARPVDERGANQRDSIFRGGVAAGEQEGRYEQPITWATEDHWRSGRGGSSIRCPGAPSRE